MESGHFIVDTLYYKRHFLICHSYFNIVLIDTQFSFLINMYGEMEVRVHEFVTSLRVNMSDQLHNLPDVSPVSICVEAH
jgi:hypothetical protein